MRRFWMLAVIITCAVECLAGDGREELSALQSEMDQFQGARRAIENNPGGSQADKLRKLFADETIKRLYNKYPAFASATWENYAADLEKELKSVERKYKMPRYSPGADESMIEILEPTLAQLKKEYEGLGKKDAKRNELKKRIDDLQSQLDTHKKLATVEKGKWENKSAKVAAERDAALTKIAEKVNGELDAFVELHYQIPIKKLKEREAQSQKLQVAKEQAAREASRKLAEKQKLAAWEARKRKLEQQYRKLKVWYKEQLDYNDLEESFFCQNTEYQWQLDLTRSNDPSVVYEIVLRSKNSQDDGWLNYPRSMTKGFAKELIDARLLIFFYEDPDAGKGEDIRWCNGEKFVPSAKRTYIDFSNDNSQFTANKEAKEREAKIAERNRRSALYGLSAKEKKRFLGKTAEEILSTREREAQEKLDKEQAAAEAEALQEQRQALLDQMTPAERRAVKGMTVVEMAQWLQNKRQKELDARSSR